jgi:hypothetical protein
MGEHTDLPAMVGFVRKHVAEHFRTAPEGSTAAQPRALLDYDTSGLSGIRTSAHGLPIH